MRIGLVALCAALLGGAASAQTAPVPMQAEMQTALNDAASQAGYPVDGPPQHSYMVLREGEGTGLKLDAQPDSTYLLASTCKSDCGELQLDLRSMDQDVLQTETSQNGLVTTQISVAKPGPMIVLAAMVGCKAESGCPTGLSIYAKKKQ